MTATCNTTYNRGQTYATDVTVNNFVGTNSFTVAATGDFGVRWNEINVVDARSCCFVTDQAGAITSYASTYESRTSYQSCTVMIPLYSTMNGAEDTEEGERRNIDYLRAIREGRSFNVLTGFRVWPSKSSKDTDASGDAPAF